MGTHSGYVVMRCLDSARINRLAPFSGFAAVESDAQCMLCVRILSPQILVGTL